MTKFDPGTFGRSQSDALVTKFQLITLIILTDPPLSVSPTSLGELAKLVINFVLPLRSRDKCSMEFRLKPEFMKQLALLRAFDLITAQKAKLVIETLWREQSSRDLLEVLDLKEFELDLEEIIGKIVSREVGAVEDYKSGKKAAFGHLMGIAMKELKDYDNPKEVKQILERYLNVN